MFPDLTKNLTSGFTQNKDAQVQAFQNFGNMFSKPKISPSSFNNNTKVNTSSGTKTPTQQSGSPMMSSVYIPPAPSQPQPVQTPAFVPPAIDFSIDNEIPADSLNGNQTPSTIREKNKKNRNDVLNSRFDREEKKLLETISSLNMGIANLSATQQREMFNLERNPEGKLSRILSADIGRLSREQAIELNARTGQLNAALDTLELYQGYRPQIVGTPQIDETTGEAFAYLQDPMTGEVTTQSLGMVSTPNPYANAISMSEGQSLIDPTTGEIIRTIPKTVASTTGDINFGSISLTDFDPTDPEQISQLPVSTLTKAIMSGTGTMKDITPTQKAQVLSEMYSIGFSPQQYVSNRLNGLVDLWKQVPNSHKGLIQGLNPLSTKINPAAAEFESSKTILNRIVARLNDVGMLSDQDVADYRKAMPSRTDGSLEVVQSKVSGITQAVTGKKTTGSYQEGTEVQLDDGTVAVYRGGDFYNKFTGELVNVEE